MFAIVPLVPLDRVLSEASQEPDPQLVCLLSFRSWLYFLVANLALVLPWLPQVPHLVAPALFVAGASRVWWSSLA